jgi:signal transduction histidine kinase/CheY-like chemotaxis protein
MLAIVPLLVTVFAMFYRQEVAGLTDMAEAQGALREALQSGFSKAFAALLLLSGIAAWWLVLAHKSRQVAQEESNRQTHLLMQEIASHQQTDRALQEAKGQAEAARRAAEQANQAKSRYISAISHELRTPLNSILGYAQLLGEDLSIPPHRKQAVSVIKRGGEHLLQLIEGTLDLAHIESGKLSLTTRPMEFARGMADIAGMFELQASEKGLGFHFEVQGSLPAWVRADERRVRQILFNLLGNAVKFIQTGTVTLRVRYAREMAHIDIEDTGSGMAPGELERIFEPFTRGAGTSAGQAPSAGAGLGLTIAKMLTDLMGGELTAASTVGQGSVFRVRLFLPEIHPLHPTQYPAVPTSVGTARKGYAGPRRKVLVVDNEEADRDLLVHLLAPLGFEVRVAASGHDALDLMASGLLPDAVLMDLAMPGIDGWETIRRIRALGGDQPRIAVVSANAFERSAEHVSGIAPGDFHVKPLRHTELLDWLAHALELQWADVHPEEVDSPHPVMSAAAPFTDAADLPRAELLALQELVHLGFFRGIMNKLDALASAYPDSAAFLNEHKGLAQRYQFETMLTRLHRMLNAPLPHGH